MTPDHQVRDLARTSHRPVVSPPKGPSASYVLWLVVIIVVVTGCRTPLPGSFTVGIYGAPILDLPELSVSGFTHVAGPADRRYLDAAQQIGLKVLAAPGTSAGPAFDRDAARRVIQVLDRHPALWSWYLADEPDMHGIPPAQVREAHRFLKQVGARKPTSLVLYNGFEAAPFARQADILMIDRYPIDWMPLATFEQHLRLAHHARRDERQPLFAVIQAFDWRLYPELMSAQGPTRPPTYEELRCMTYCSLIQQVDGIFFYTFDDGKWKMRENPETWDALKKVVAEIHERESLFQAEHVWWPWRQALRYESSGVWNEVYESAVVLALLRFPLSLVPGQQDYYIVGVNTSRRPHTLQIKLPFRGVDRLNVLGEHRVLEANDHRIKDTFEPLGVHVYGPVNVAVNRSNDRAPQIEARGR